MPKCLTRAQRDKVQFAVMQVLDHIAKPLDHIAKPQKLHIHLVHCQAQANYLNIFSFNTEFYIPLML